MSAQYFLSSLLPPEAPPEEPATRDRPISPAEVWAEGLCAYYLAHDAVLRAARPANGDGPVRKEPVSKRAVQRHREIGGGNDEHDPMPGLCNHGLRLRPGQPRHDCGSCVR